MKNLYSKKYPSTHILNPAKPYVHSSATDIRKTFERVRAENPQSQKAKIRRVR